MPRIFAAALVVCAIVSSARAQVIYEPVRYQYGQQTTYYYGGSDPDMFRYAHREYSEAHDGFAMARGDVTVHREVSQYRPHVYVDHLPRANAAMYGYTADDARNDAYWNAARYFRKSDILKQSTVDCDGALHVAPEASSEHCGTIEIKPYVQPTTAPKMILKFDKGLLDRKMKEEPKKVASVQ